MQMSRMPPLVKNEEMLELEECQSDISFTRDQSPDNSETDRSPRAFKTEYVDLFVKAEKDNKNEGM